MSVSWETTNTTFAYLDQPPPAAPAQRLTHLNVVSWADPFLQAHGYDVRSGYVERFWLGILGPSGTWLLRRLARGLDEHPGGYRINVADTSRALGLGEGTGRNSMVVRTIDRLCQFGAAQLIGEQLAVRTHVAPLTSRQLARLPVAVQRAHARWQDDPIEPRQQQRALAIAIGLLERGADPTTLESQLSSYGFSDRLAHDTLGQALRIARTASQRASV